MKLTRRDVLAGTAAVAASATPLAAEPPVLVAAASDLQVALPKIAEAFRHQGGPLVSISFGSTGNHARQIRQGAPFEVFLAADESFIESLANEGVLADQGSVYARGRVALVAAKDGAFAGPLSLGTVAAAVQSGQPFRVAIANPEHAPYGRRAMEALVSQGVELILRPRLVYGDTVAQAMQLVASRAAAVGLVSASLTTSGPAADAVTSVVLPGAWHSPIIQRLAITRKGGDAARRFAAFVLGPVARHILATDKFDAP